MELVLDDGLQFGLGLFETIAVENGIMVFPEWHLERLQHSMSVFGIVHEDLAEKADQFLAEQNEKSLLHHHGLKIIATKENLLFSIRENHYEAGMYEKGFQADFSRVYRNETSSLVYHKTMNYGDCILEKRASAAEGMQERIFLNSRGELSEGTVSNVFFVRGHQIYTPRKEAGLLPGIMRRFVLESCPELGLEVACTSIRPEDLTSMEECFVTNSLMGIMPVVKLGEHVFSKGPVTQMLMEHYRKYLASIQL